MEIQEKSGHLMHDLALIYIALAHSTDGDLDQREVDVIADRLRGWQSDATSETVLSAIKQALEDYVEDGAHEKVEHAISHLGREMPEERRQAIVDDLVEIAMADGKMIHEESTFIGSVADAWNVHADAGRNGARSWSILYRAGEDETWTPLHDLTLIYLTLAHRTDQDLSDEEVDAITQKLGEWLPDAEEPEVYQVVQEAIMAYGQNRDERILETAIASVKQRIPGHQRNALLADLRYVAFADGVLLDEEQAMIDRLSRAWEIPSVTPVERG